MIVLGIETSGRLGSVAVARDDDCLGERILSRTGRRHARTLVVELRQLLDTAGLSPADVEIVAVSIGPGSFTGLRVGLVCAKTIAYALRAALIAVDTFQAVACNAPRDVVDQYVIGDAQRGDVFAGRFHRTQGDWWEREAEIETVALKSWRDRLPADAVVSGPGLEVHADDLQQYRLLDSGCWTPRAFHIACIGRARAASGDSDDPYSIEPVYIRKSGAEEKLERRLRRAGEGPI